MKRRYSYPLSTGCYGIDLKLFPPTPSYEVKPYRRLRPYGSSLPSQYNASCAGRRSRSTCEERKPFSDFTVAVGQALKWLAAAKELILQTRIIFFRRDSPTAAATLRPQRGMKTGATRSFGAAVAHTQSLVNSILKIGVFEGLGPRRRAEFGRSDHANWRRLSLSLSARTCARSYCACCTSQLSALPPKTLDSLTAISGEMPRFLFTSSDKVVRVTPRASAASVMVKPKGSMHWRSTKPPG